MNPLLLLVLTVAGVRVQLLPESITLISADCHLSIPMPEGYPKDPGLAELLVKVPACIDLSKSPDKQLGSSDVPFDEKLFDFRKRGLLSRLLGSKHQCEDPLGKANFDDGTLTCWNHSISGAQVLKELEPVMADWDENIDVLLKAITDWAGVRSRQTHPAVIGSYTAATFRDTPTIMWIFGPKKFKRFPTLLVDGSSSFDPTLARKFCNVVLARMLKVYGLVFTHRWSEGLKEPLPIPSAEFINHALFSRQFLMLPPGMRKDVDDYRTSVLAADRDALSGNTEPGPMVGGFLSKFAVVDDFASKVAELIAAGDIKGASAKMKKALADPVKSHSESKGVLQYSNESLSKHITYQTKWNPETQSTDTFLWNEETGQFDIPNVGKKQVDLELPPIEGAAAEPLDRRDIPKIQSSVGVHVPIPRSELELVTPLSETRTKQHESHSARVILGQPDTAQNALNVLAA